MDTFREFRRNMHRAGLNDTRVIQRFIASIAPLIAEWAILRPDMVALEQQVMRRSAPKRKGGAPTSASQAASDAFNERAKVLQGVITAMLSTLVGCPQFDKHGKNTNTMAWDLHDNAWWGLGPPTHTRGTSITKPQKKALAVRAVQGCIDYFGKRPGGWVERVWESNDVKFDLADSLLHALNLASIMTPAETGKLNALLEARPAAAPSISRVSATKCQLAARNAVTALLCDGCDGTRLPPWVAAELLDPDGLCADPPPLIPASVVKKHRKVTKRARKATVVVEKDSAQAAVLIPDGAPAKDKNYVVYLLQSANGRSIYIGASNDPDRRLRQHNGELAKGAKRTRMGRPWRTVLRVEGFGCKPVESHSAALKFEKAFQCCRLANGKNPVGPRRRVEALNTLLARWVCPMGPLTRTELFSVPGSKIAPVPAPEPEPSTKAPPKKKKRCEPPPPPPKKVGRAAVPLREATSGLDSEPE